MQGDKSRDVVRGCDRELKVVGALSSNRKRNILLSFNEICFHIF